MYYRGNRTEPFFRIHSECYPAADSYLPTAALRAVWPSSFRTETESGN